VKIIKTKYLNTPSGFSDLLILQHVNYSLLLSFWMPRETKRIYLNLKWLMMITRCTKVIKNLKN